MSAEARRVQWLRKDEAELRRWIEECGGSQTGYIINYGSHQDEDHVGDGGEAIYAADIARLRAVQAELARLVAP